MAKHYEWNLGEPPPSLGRHSLAKHEVLRMYLEKYVAVLTARPSQESLRLTLVDGYAGGGVYLHPESQIRIPGSPLIMLNAMCAAQTTANKCRKKPFFLDVEYFFIEMMPETAEYLRGELRGSRNASLWMDRIQVLTGCFSDRLDAILARVEERGRSRRVIFVLDQYGFSDVRMPDLRKIFSRLPNAEVILTVAVDWLIDYCTEEGDFDRLLNELGIGLTASSIIAAKQQNPPDWRPVIQHMLHDAFFRSSGATYYTPFFVFSPAAHRACWLLHFSGHSKARDVMAQLHWDLTNHFQHFGKAGLCMLGHDPRKDYDRWGYRPLPFGFDSLAAEETRYALMEQIPRRIAESNDGIRFEDFFNKVVNETPATKQMIAKAIGDLALEKELQVRTAEGKQRHNGVRIADDDIICRP